MADHDQRFKTLVRHFFREFVALFYAGWLGLLDLARLEWLEQEVFADPPRGRKLAADLVCRVPLLQPVPGLRPGEEAADSIIVHTEVEFEDHLTDLRGRVYDYHKHFRSRYHVPVLSTGLFLRVALHGQGTDVFEESFQGVRTRFEYPYVGLPGLDAVQYVQGDNVLGFALAALMRIDPDRRGWLAAEALRRILESKEELWRKYLLAECVQAYLPLAGEQRRLFEELIQQEPYREVKNMAKTWFEEFKEEGERTILVKQLEKKFGPLSTGVMERIKEWETQRLEQAGVDLLDAHSLAELGLGEEHKNGA